MKHLIFVLLPILAFFSCKGKERIVYQHHTDSVFVVHTDTFTRMVEVVRTDTIRQRDSILLREVVQVKVSEKGDTIWRDRVVYRDRWHDAAESKTSAADSQTASVSNAGRTEIRTDTVYVKDTGTAAPSLKDRAQSYGALAIAFLALIVLLVVSTKKE